MTQNTSHAVMAKRSEPHTSLDFFPTPPWATRALCEGLPSAPDQLATMNAWEPACGAGHMARPLAEYFARVHASDVHPYGFGEVRDFLFAGDDPTADWIITNPPFRLADQFAEVAIQRARVGAALLVRTAFLEGVSRYKNLFRRHPPHSILQFTERVPMHRGRLVQDGSTATAYCWIVWTLHRLGREPIFCWIPPCRRRLERLGDYV